jgi:integrase
MSKVSVKDRLVTLKACLLWAEEEGLLPQRLPRNVKSFARIKTDRPTPKFFTREELITLYNAASQRTRLYIALALNTGATQVDIATLTHDMIDWKEGTITRDRHKSGVPGCWKLWPITLELLRAEATDPRESELVLMGEKGNPLINERIKNDGSPVKTDSIRLAFERLRRKLKMDGGRTFKHFRKTAADLIAKQYQDKPFLVDLFLAHVPPGTNGHYVSQPFDLLHTATDWLGSTLKLGEPRAEDQAK